MPKLRDYFFSDLLTFINSDEFAVKAIIEDEEVDVVLDSDKLKERQMNNHTEGIHTEELLFHVSKSGLSFYPRSGNRVRVDGSLWKVIDVQEDEGLFTITVEWVSA
ncbi:head-tail joining protein [Bacillus solitudinis]|uniref:head-tail joining protein n=1 Tax=Bacillus solitudinis TaxID=2014074 RepID=UPI000C248F27|nr:hypothetical protein [Bacillus solitudinis]